MDQTLIELDDEYCEPGQHELSAGKPAGVTRQHTGDGRVLVVESVLHICLHCPHEVTLSYERYEQGPRMVV